MIETGQNEESNAAEFFSLKLIKETKEMYVFSVIFPQASKNIYGGVQGGMISAAMDEATFVSILRSQENIKKIRVEGVSGSNSVKVILDGDGEMQKIEISDDIFKENKSIIEDLIVAAHNNAKLQLKSKTSEEISKATGGFGIPGFKWPL